MHDAPSSKAILHFDNVGLRYAQASEVLKDISFSLPHGSFRFLTGKSGAGKTSLLRLMYLSQRPSRGSISLFGIDVNKATREELPFIREKIGVVFQDFRLLDHLSVFDNVALPLRLGNIYEPQVKKNVSELLSFVGLSDRMDAKPLYLSGGEKQRASIARAVVNHPRLLLADEPTGNVDDKMADRLLHLLIELNKLGTTVVLATHNEALIRRYGFTRFHLSDGKLKTYPGIPNAGSMSLDEISDLEKGGYSDPDQSYEEKEGGRDDEFS